MKRVVAAAALLVLLPVACSKKVEPPKTAVSAPAPAPAPVQLPPGHPPIETPAQPSAAPQTSLTGKVLETMDSGGYTYLKLRTGSGDVWAAVQQTKVDAGATVTIAPQMTLDNFESKTLKRRFDHIVFGTMAAPAAPAAAAPAAAPPKAHGDTGRTIADVWAQKDTLKDAPVTVRGTVVKFLPSIMGKNWLHLRDGGERDITVTTTDTAAVGDVVVVSGTLRLDKDFGAGYRYPVIVEEAKVVK